MFYLGCSDNLLEFAARIGCLDYLITSDSLALHLAISHQVKNLSFYAPTSASEVGTFNTGVKLVSLSSDYCSYSGACDNKTITSERIFDLFLTHVENYEIS